jgi:hypothetical protein
MLTPDRHTLLDQSLGQVTLMPWLRASAEERKKALHPFQALAVVERWRRRGRGLTQVHALLSLHQGASRGLSDDRLAEEILDAVKAQQLIALPGWVSPRAEPVAPILPELPLPPPPPARVRKEATADDVEPTIRLVNLESRYFVPQEESIRISYAIDGPVAKAAEVRMKVKSLGAHLQDQVVELRNVPPPYEASGSLLWNGKATTGAGYITLRDSPYEITFELTSTSGTLSVSDPVEVAVIVSSVRIMVDASGHLPVSDRHRLAIEALATDLEESGLPGDCSGRVAIDGPVFPVNYAEMTGPASSNAYAEWAGDGVPVPLVADVLLRSKTGRASRAPVALVGTRLLWDFEHGDPDAISDELWNGRGVVGPQLSFLSKIVARDADTSLPKGTGATHALGGRRESPSGRHWRDRTFWKSSAGTPLDRPASRVWAAFTPCQGDRALPADSGIYFLSGRIAGDTHRVSATLALDDSLDRSDDQAPLVAHLRSNTLTLTNWRRVPIVGNWLVGEPNSAVDLRTVGGWLGAAAVTVEEVQGLGPVNVGPQWEKAYRDVVDELVARRGAFFPLALEREPGRFAVRFRSFAEYQERLAAESPEDRKRRRELNFFTARNEASYRRRCEQRSGTVLDKVMPRFSLPEGGLTVMKFHSPGLHNQEVPRSGTGGLFMVVPGQSDRSRAVIMQFTEDSQPEVTVHEVGHALFLEHAPGHTSDASDPDEAIAEHHSEDARCVMSYRSDANSFCGLCVLKLGGWKYWKVGRDGTIRE